LFEYLKTIFFCFWKFGFNFLFHYSFFSLNSEALEEKSLWFKAVATSKLIFFAT